MKYVHPDNFDYRRDATTAVRRRGGYNIKQFWMCCFLSAMGIRLGEEFDGV